MKTLNWLKKVSLGLIGLIFVIPAAKSADVAQVESTCSPSSTEEQQIRVNFSKEDLIKSLRNMNRHPESVRTICAMCYKAAVLPKEVNFQCDICDEAQIYLRESDQGALIVALPYIKRSLSTTPYRITIDSIGLCPSCGKGKDKALIMNVNCFSCGKKFSWEVKNKEDIANLKWLYLKPPIKEVDCAPGEWPKQGTEQEVVKNGAKYIYEHIFCWECRRGIKID